MKTIDLVYRTMYAELVQRCLDAAFQTDFPTTGNFVKVPVKDHLYWYFEETQPTKKRRYVGPDSDPEIARRVNPSVKSKTTFVRVENWCPLSFAKQD